MSPDTDSIDMAGTTVTVAVFAHAVGVLHKHFFITPLIQPEFSNDSGSPESQFPYVPDGMVEPSALKPISPFSIHSQGSVVDNR